MNGFTDEGKMQFDTIWISPRERREAIPNEIVVLEKHPLDENGIYSKKKIQFSSISVVWRVFALCKWASFYNHASSNFLALYLYGHADEYCWQEKVKIRKIDKF